MTLVGLEYMKNQEMARHNRSTENQAERDRISRENVAASDRSSRERVASLDRSSREQVSSADRASRESIAQLDRIADTETKRYGSDMQYLSRVANPIANTVLSSAIVTDRIGSDNWGSTQDTSALRDLITSTIQSADTPIKWSEGAVQQITDEIVGFLQPLLDPNYQAPGPITNK